jgi:hypothetical protein
VSAVQLKRRSNYEQEIATLLEDPNFAVFESEQADKAMMFFFQNNQRNAILVQHAINTKADASKADSSKVNEENNSNNATVYNTSDLVTTAVTKESDTAYNNTSLTEHDSLPTVTSSSVPQVGEKSKQQSTSEHGELNVIASYLMGKTVYGPVIVMSSAIGKNKELYQLFRPGKRVLRMRMEMILTHSHTLSSTEFVQNYKEPLCSDANLGWKIEDKPKLRQQIQQATYHLRTQHIPNFVEKLFKESSKIRTAMMLLDYIHQHGINFRFVEKTEKM